MSRWIVVDPAPGKQGQLLQHRDNPGHWKIRVTLRRDASGKRRTRSQTIRGTKRQAQAALTDMLQQRNTGRITTGGSMTLQALIEKWLEHKAGKVTERTHDSYRHNLITYVLPAIGHHRLNDLTLQMIHDFYASMSAGTLPEAAKEVGWKGESLSARTVRYTHAILSQALTYAVRTSLISINPAEHAELPSQERAEKLALSSSQRHRFLTASQGSFYRVLYQFLMDTGLRPGEAMALTWDDFDLPRMAVKVTKAVSTDSSGQRVVKGPKNAASRRSVPIVGLTELLEEHKAWQQSVGLHDSGLVFTNMDGGPLTPRTFSRRELQRIIKSIGIDEPFSLYNFRHTFATLKLESGVPLKVVSEWLGHSSIQLTADTYQHVSHDINLSWAEKHHQHISEQAVNQEARVTN